MVSQSVGRSGSMVGRLVGWLVGCSMCRYPRRVGPAELKILSKLFGCLVGWLLSWLQHLKGGALQERGLQRWAVQETAALDPETCDLGCAFKPHTSDDCLLVIRCWSRTTTFTRSTWQTTIPCSIAFCAPCLFPPLTSHVNIKYTPGRMRYEHVLLPP